MRSSARAWLGIVAALLLDAAALPAAEEAPKLVTPAEYLATLTPPVFRAGHTLPPLTRYGWTLPFDLKVALAERWGYCLEFGGYADAKLVAKLEDPNSDESKLVALTAKDPARYPLFVILSRELPEDLPPEVWTRDAEGKLVEGKETWSPEAPDAALQAIADLQVGSLRKILAKCPVAIILNGGESLLNVYTWGGKYWAQDPKIMKAKGERDWHEYISERKAHQELIITKAVREAAPDRTFYLLYTFAGGGKYRNSSENWWHSSWGLPWMLAVSDLPNTAAYYAHMNSGWVGENDNLTQQLNAIGNELAYGEELSYNWMCGGWPRGEGGLSDIPTYMGFLKCLYTAGMIGANAGYYAFPKGGFSASFEPGAPPHWLQQMVALGQVHALFSHLEGYLRQGYLLPGPDRHRWSKDQPAYEFPTGEAGTRVVARKLRAGAEWLVTAWAADGKDREVKVTIPALGEVRLQARACGSVYRGILREGAPVLTLIDTDGLHPTANAETLKNLE